MIKNKWMTACLFLGCLLSVALISGLSTYSKAIIHRMLQRGYELREIETNLHPMNYTIKNRYATGKAKLTIEELEASNNQAMEYFYDLDLPYIAYRKSFYVSDISFSHVSLEGPEEVGKRTTMFTLAEFTDIFNHINIVNGRRPEPAKDEVEVMVSQESMFKLRLALGSRYQINSIKDKDGKPIVLRVVAVFEPKDKNEPYWFGVSKNLIHIDPDAYDTPFFTSILCEQEHIIFNSIIWEFALDYRSLTPDKVEDLLLIVQRQDRLNNSASSMTLSNVDILETFVSKEKQLSTFLMVLQVPVVALLALYTVMISNLIFAHDKNERANMKSRGSGKFKILSIYIYQSVIIVILSLAIGIPLSLNFCELIGSANGFLEFVSRTPLDVSISFESVVFAIVGAVVFLLSMLLPLVFSKEDSIVNEKRKRSRTSKTFFEKYFIDLILISLSLIGLYTYDNLTKILTQAGVSATEIPINPLLYIISTMFIFGLSLFFIRIYPYLIELIFRVGQSVWPTTIYTSLINTARCRSSGRFLMVFLVTTMSLGIFSSAAARTINKNYEDKIAYRNGADIRLKEEWIGVDPDPQYNSDGYLIQKPEKDLLYQAEPSFEKYLNLEGVRSATRVYTNDRAYLLRRKFRTKEITVICIVPNEFSNVAWNRQDMYPYHFNYMLNAMTINPNAILVSESLMEKLELRSGDVVDVSWDNNHRIISCFVYDSVKFFPTFDPTEIDARGDRENLIVMNYNMVKELWSHMKFGFQLRMAIPQLIFINSLLIKKSHCVTFTILLQILLP